MPKLTIVVPHYKEPFEDCQFLFDTIATQHGIDFADITVMVVNDGNDVVWGDEVFAPYGYHIDYIVKEHGGLSHTRNYGLDHAETEYVMFCDCDDGFLNNYGLHLVFSAMQEGFDFLHSTFIEEQKPADGSWSINRRSKDLVFVHGKVYRTQFLRDKGIRFDTRLWFSEDSVFNKIAYHEAGERVKYIDTPFYLWAWHDNSTVRKDAENLIVKNYDQVMLMRTLVCERLKERGFMEEFYDSVCQTIMDSFYDFSEPAFLKPANKPFVVKAEKEFKKFYQKFSKAFFECKSDRIATQMMQARLRAYNAGLQMERTDLKTWLKHIKNDVKL